MHSEQSVIKVKSSGNSIYYQCGKLESSHADSIFWTVLVNKTDYYPFMMVGVEVYKYLRWSSMHTRKFQK